MSGSAVVTEGQVVRTRVRAIAAGGAGVADLPDGRVVFVDRTAPGDEVEIRIARLHARWGEGELLSLQRPGGERVEPSCPLYDRCGGCALQHLEYGEQLRWKGRIVGDALKRVGGLEVGAPEVVGSPVVWKYRNRVTFTVRRLGGGRTVAGFHALHRPGRVVDVGSECLLPEPPVSDAWAALRDSWRRGEGPLPSGRELRVTIRAVEDGVVILVRGGAEGWRGEELMAHVAGVVGVWHQPRSERRARLVGGAATFEAWGADRVLLGGEAFLQVNRACAPLLLAHVLRMAGVPTSRPRGGQAVDAYCGVGVYGRALATRGWTVTGIESDPDACTAARHEAPEGFSVVEGLVEERLPSLLPAELVIVNPPRTGLQEWVPGILQHHRPGRVIYVSCDPATLARDAARMSPGYRLVAVRAFDLFPQTAHVETVAVFETKARGS
jgi:23S rRNA (uracil1939-C5)-methyltransferase